MRVAIYPKEYYNATPKEQVTMEPKGIFEVISKDSNNTFWFKDKLPENVIEGDIIVILD